tara:strand:+ start:875 stop:1045 length:171 start_codon:yes stop_codon:yes gene_type:complete
MFFWIEQQFGRRLPREIPAARAHQEEVMSAQSIKRSLLVAGVAMAGVAGVFVLLSG